MSWAAANVPRNRKENDNGVSTKAKESRKRGETVEAVLSRLSKAYSVAMECFGAIVSHETNTTLKRNYNEEEMKELLQSLSKVTCACRQTLETALIMDPLIECRTLRHTFHQFADRDQKAGVTSRWVDLCRPRPEPPQINSKAHRSTIRQLSYLALTNYADLLMSVCTCSCDRKPPPNKQKLLDKGVVKKLKGFSDNHETLGCCWAQDSEQDIQRLALVALCDASSLDGTDPVVWLKLACAARSMGHIKALPDGLNNPILSPFRRLERHALESGLCSLPSNVPPNRAIARAWDEFNEDQLPDSYPPVLAQAPAASKLSLDLTRYSWSLLGRLLMKAFREGTGAGDAVTSQGKVASGSPSISLSISPLLLLPSSVLTRILSFLETQSIWKFEATCRALSVSIISVRATLEKQGVHDQEKKTLIPESEEKEDAMDDDVKQAEMKTENPLLAEKEDTMDDDAKQAEMNPENPPPAKNKDAMDDDAKQADMKPENPLPVEKEDPMDDDMQSYLKTEKSPPDENEDTMDDDVEQAEVKPDNPPTAEKEDPMDDNVKQGNMRPENPPPAKREDAMDDDVKQAEVKPDNPPTAEKEDPMDDDFKQAEMNPNNSPTAEKEEAMDDDVKQAEVKPANPPPVEKEDAMDDDVTMEKQADTNSEEQKEGDITPTAGATAHATEKPSSSRGPTSPSVKDPVKSSRSSKRVRSQQINSDKKDERIRKRTSVEFCLRSATLGAANDKILESIDNEPLEWDKVRGSSWQLPAGLESNTAVGTKGKASSAEVSRQRFEASERIGSSSLSSFLDRMSSQNAGPTYLLEQYLGHIALHLEEVFSVDPGDTMVLTASIMGCLELLMQKKAQSKLLPQFFDHEDLSCGHTIDQSLRLFAIDVLNVELRFKTCERQQNFCVGFDDDPSFVCCMIPALLGGMAHLDEKLVNKSKDWIKLKTRVNWLVAGVYLWRSRLTRSVCESIEAEEQGLKFIDATIDCLAFPSTCSVVTPHLDSPVRHGGHWRNLCKESLSTYRDEIQASSVVSHVQQQFQERIAMIIRRSNDGDGVDMTEEDTSALSGIGETLLARYKEPFGSVECKHAELMDNFISIYGEECLPGPGDIAASAEKVADSPLPVGAVDVKLFIEMSNTSILTILVTCLQVKPSSQKALVVLLVRLLLTALNRHEQICCSATNESESPDNFSDSDDADSVENDATSDVVPGENGNTSKTDAMKCGRLINYLLEKVPKSISNLSSEAKAEVATSNEFLQLIHHSLGFCSSWVSHFSQQPSALEEVLDRKVFVSTSALVHSFLDDDGTSKFVSLKELYIGGLVRILHSQQQSFASLVRVQGTIRARRAVRQRICVLTAEFIGTVLCELSRELSEDLSTIKEGRMARSKVLQATLFGTIAITETPSSSPAQVQILCETLLWFSRYSKDAEENPSNSFDRPILDRLRVPLIAAIVSFCGSGSCTRSEERKPDDPKSLEDTNQITDNLALKEFLDSDASAHEFSEKEEGKKEGRQPFKKELLRVLCHLVQCIVLVFGRVEEKEIVSFDNTDFYHTTNGPLLPLVVSRVLNHVADTLLVEFADDENESDAQGVWAPKFPFGTGATGFLLDSALYKAYKCLHGFTLIGSNDKYSAKDHVQMTTGDIETKFYAPESQQAAAQLYRCIVRAGKKTPPKAALETVSSALPPLKESKKSRMISEFLFSTSTKNFEVEEITAIALESQGWTNFFEVVLSWKDEETPDDHDIIGGKQSECKATDDEVMFLRKGVFALLAQGDLPVFSNDFGGKEDNRAGAIRFEDELSKKFIAIFNTLKYGDINDLRGWFRAAQCLMFKADAIAERLGLSEGFSRIKNFFIPEHRIPAVSRLSIAALEEKQEKEAMVSGLGWIRYLGEDLSLYINYHWSSFESLKKLSEKILVASKTHDVSGEDEVEAFMAQVKKEIHEMQEKGRLMEWQQSWGGMFVTALKQMAMRCLCLAVYLFHENISVMKSEGKDLMPEILETMGLTTYSGLLGSQTYGYPMHVTSMKLKREQAEAARACFQRAVDLARSADDGEDADTWDLVFMIGKCYEKIAGAYKAEIYPNSDAAIASKSIRLFEQYTKKALDSYRAALDEKPEIDTEAGGSSHGASEIFYRLHASRLKCLLESAVASEDERVMAEEEALRLTEQHWFSPSEQSSLQESSVRDRIWNVLADIVSALAQCRLEHAFFHRSVYRHAQALMWAPVLCDPITGRVEGSKGTVPATRSCHVRGLNHATNAASSALAVMTSLFEKKRSQLCAVWVTTSYPPTAFETLNNSARKYDSLRGKYLAAYIDCLRLCGNRNELETLLRWLSTSKRDLPSLFQASAKTEGGKPEKSHNHDSLLLRSAALSSFNLLTGLKRKANSAMAHVLTDELSSDDTIVRSKENHLKLAYACFLRLNCTKKELKKTRAWKYDPQAVWEAEAVCQAFSKLSEHEAIPAELNDWSGGGQMASILDTALRKCKQLFPSVSGSYYSKKVNQKVKSQEEAESKDANGKPASQLSGSKRSFEVKVPEGLGEGETFTTTIKGGESGAKKVKLTVPAGKPRMLRFSLDLSTQTND